MVLRQKSGRSGFAYQQLRGLKAPTCTCGNKYTPFCIVRDSKYGDLFDDN